MGIKFFCALVKLLQQTLRLISTVSMVESLAIYIGSSRCYTELPMATMAIYAKLTKPEQVGHSSRGARVLLLHRKQRKVLRHFGMGQELYDRDASGGPLIDVFPKARYPSCPLSG